MSDATEPLEGVEERLRVGLSVSGAPSDGPVRPGSAPSAPAGPEPSPEPAPTPSVQVSVDPSPESATDAERAPADPPALQVPLAAPRPERPGGHAPPTLEHRHSFDERSAPRLGPVADGDTNIEPISPEELVTLLKASNALVLDIRPTTAFSAAHITSSINLCAPTTLLKRREVTLERLEQDMLDDDETVNRITAWRNAPGAHKRYVVALDTDTVSSTGLGRPATGGGGACLLGLLHKFQAAGFAGQLRWLRGGFMRFQAAEGASQFVRHQSLQAPSAKPARRGGLRLGLSPADIPRPHSAAAGSSSSQYANPFFNNIRQDLELSMGITEHIPLDLPPLSADEVARLPRFLRELATQPEAKRAERLAQKFFEIEKSEQARLHGVMSRHTFDSQVPLRRAQQTAPQVVLSANAAYPCQREPPTAPPSADVSPFPLSITAALERGNENRYHNFWTYEHSRVKLAAPLCPTDPGSNYLNGSFINPLRHRGVHRLYVATQAPLPSTYLAFWTMIWEQRARVIVMLTQELEGGLRKCHAYWHAGAIPPLSVHVRSEQALDAHLRPVDDEGVPVFMRRVLCLANERSVEPPREIVQLQFLAWPDHGVPSSPTPLLRLIAEANAAQCAPAAAEDAAWLQPTPGPIVVHCSAGVGRSGAYILIDAALALLRTARVAVEEGKAAPEEKPALSDGPVPNGEAHRQAPSAATSSENGLTLATARACWEDDSDLIYDAVSVMREQRMSMIQTTRQFVFVYRAVLLALLSDP